MYSQEKAREARLKNKNQNTRFEQTYQHLKAMGEKMSGVRQVTKTNKTRQNKKPPQIKNPNNKMMLEK